MLVERGCEALWDLLRVLGPILMALGDPWVQSSTHLQVLAVFQETFFLEDLLQACSVQVRILFVPTANPFLFWMLFPQLRIIDQN